MPLLSDHPLLEGGIYVVRPPGAQPSRKIRLLTELLVECFDERNH